MEDLQLLADFYKHTDRQGPGGDEETIRAFDLTQADRTAPLNIADIGCGTGASALLLARITQAHITAVDFLSDFLHLLEERAEKLELSDRIETICCSMEKLPFEKAEFDIIWSEGAIYNIGFERGVREWRQYLKAGGILVASELIWITGSRPVELQSYWKNEYSEIEEASSKIGLLERNGYSPIGYFVLPEQCWIDNYYRPHQNNFDDFIRRHNNNNAAITIVEQQKEEIEMYKRYKKYYGYGMFIARKVE